MPRYIVRVCRDALVWFEAEIEAESQEAIEKQMTNHGLRYDGLKKITNWEQLDPEVFDEVEEYEIEEI